MNRTGRAGAGGASRHGFGCPRHWAFNGQDVERQHSVIRPRLQPVAPPSASTTTTSEPAATSTTQTIHVPTSESTLPPATEPLTSLASLASTVSRFPCPTSGLVWTIPGFTCQVRLGQLGHRGMGHCDEHSHSAVATITEHRRSWFEVRTTPPPADHLMPLLVPHVRRVTHRHLVPSPFWLALKPTPSLDSRLRSGTVTH
jgi:hypothetical protein